ncbi:DUF4115 domain-containing protein [Phormidesmis priestleyi ULC007]|uniref:non-specific serine/threonine protein kinase n=1 Tax=Phormidesmis priestleyi ULC007 TaxID=1920490 RepID=A0A2T1DCD4_9CYAN|nr:RodZ domain-containing protein [Phormidesmis priestleyi]PSB18126.1 DUF4115 domain-containing protein [Phormidesmis priestleyi ULC007]PZO49604.1 MAG: DUF4115 domain-containing protein [Phormidesmis priestleyi]
MSYCLNPTCAEPQNRSEAEVCQHCGLIVQLQNRYRAINPIGQGGFGRTFLAVNEAELLKPRCVIKQFFPQQQDANLLKTASQLFQREAQRLEQLGHHPQIPTLLAYLEQDHHQYLVQEWIDGQTLEQELKMGAFTENQIRQLLQDLLPVLQFIHHHHVIHRDIKPANIIRRRVDRTLVLVDLGAAKFATGTALLKTGTMIGSAEYTAPEQIRGKAVFSSDLYSLGVTCIHLLTQMSPFDLFDGTEGQWIWRDYLTHSVSDRLGKVLDKLLESATNRRYRSAESAIADLSSAPQLEVSRSVEPTTPWQTIAETLVNPLIALDIEPAKPLATAAKSGAARFASRQHLRISNWSFPAALIVLSLPIFLMSVLRAVSSPRHYSHDFAKPASQSATIVAPHLPVTVSILMTDRAWVSITVDGKLEFEGVLPEGIRQTWTADQQIILQAGNAGALVVSFNQTPDQVFGKFGEIKEVIFSN